MGGHRGPTLLLDINESNCNLHGTYLDDGLNLEGIVTGDNYIVLK